MSGESLWLPPGEPKPYVVPGAWDSSSPSSRSSSPTPTWATHPSPVSTSTPVLSGSPESTSDQDLATPPTPELRAWDLGRTAHSQLPKEDVSPPASPLFCASPEPMLDTERTAPDYTMPMSTEERRARWPWPLRPPPPSPKAALESSERLLNDNRPLCESPEPMSDSGAAPAPTETMNQATDVRRPPPPPPDIDTAPQGPLPRTPPQPTPAAAPAQIRPGLATRLRLALRKQPGTFARFRFTPAPPAPPKLTEVRPENATRVRFVIDERGMARLNRRETIAELKERYLAKERRRTGFSARRAKLHRAMALMRAQRAREARMQAVAAGLWRVRFDEDGEWEDEEEEHGICLPRETRTVHFAPLPVRTRSPKAVVLDSVFPRGTVQMNQQNKKEPHIMLTRAVLRSLSMPAHDCLPKSLNAEQRRIVKRAETRRTESMLVPVVVENNGKQRVVPKPKQPGVLETVGEEDEYAAGDEEDLEVLEEQYMLAVLIGLVDAGQPGGTGETVLERSAFIEEIDSNTEGQGGDVDKVSDDAASEATFRPMKRATADGTERNSNDTASEATIKPTRRDTMKVLQPEKTAATLPQIELAEPNPPADISTGPSCSTARVVTARQDTQDSLPRIPWAAKGKWKAVSMDNVVEDVGVTAAPKPEKTIPLVAPAEPEVAYPSDPKPVTKPAKPSTAATRPAPQAEKTIPSARSQKTKQSFHFAETLVASPESTIELDAQLEPLSAPAIPMRYGRLKMPVGDLYDLEEDDWASLLFPPSPLVESPARHQIALTPAPVPPPPSPSAITPSPPSVPLTWNLVPIKMKPKPQWIPLQWIPWSNPRPNLQPPPQPQPESEDEDEEWHDCRTGPLLLTGTETMPSTPPPAYRPPTPRFEPLKWMPQVVGGEEPSQERYAQYMGRELPVTREEECDVVQDQIVEEEELPEYEEPRPTSPTEPEGQVKEGFVVRMRRRFPPRESTAVTHPDEQRRNTMFNQSPRLS